MKRRNFITAIFGWLFVFAGTAQARNLPESSIVPKPTREDGDLSCASSAATKQNTVPAVSRTLSDRFGDIVNLKDFGAKGDGVTDDTKAWNAFQSSPSGLKYIPAGKYRVNGEIKDFASGCIGNGRFDNKAGYWNQAHIADDRTDETIIRHKAEYNASNGALDPVIKIQSNVEYNDSNPNDNTNFTRVIGGYFEGIGHGNYAWAGDGKTGNFTVLGASAHNKFAGQFGMTAVTGRVWDAKESEVPNIARLGASKSCAGYFPFTRRAKYTSGGYMIGLETYCLNTAEETNDIPYENMDNFGALKSWTAGYHCTGYGSGAPITAGIFMDGASDAKHAFWNGIVIGGSAMKIKNASGVPGTVGLNLSSWTTQRCGDIGIKFGAAGRWHQYFKNGFAFHAANTVQESHAANTTFSIRCGNSFNSAFLLQRGATENRNGTAITIGRLAIGSTAQHIDYTELESKGFQRFIVASNGQKYIFQLDSNAFIPNAGQNATPVSLGTANKKWNQLYAKNGSINTSDERVKQDITTIPDIVLDAWGKVNWQQFRMKDAVARKGENARTHSGVIAQRVKAVFEANGLDAAKYGLLCHDTWEDQYEEIRVKDANEVIDDDGRTIKPEQWHTERKLIKPAGDLYSIRYEEALAMEAAYQRRRADKLEERLAALEKRLTALEARTR